MFAIFKTRNASCRFGGCFYVVPPQGRRSQWPHGLRRRAAAARLLRLWVRIPPGAWMFVCCECCVLSGRGLCDELITRPEESYRLWCVVVCDLKTSWMWRPWPTGGCRAKNKQTNKQTSTETQFSLQQSILQKVKTVNKCMVLGLGAVVAQMVVLWVITPCRITLMQPLRGTCFLRLQGDNLVHVAASSFFMMAEFCWGAAETSERNHYSARHDDPEDRHLSTHCLYTRCVHSIRPVTVYTPCRSQLKE